MSNFPIAVHTPYPIVASLDTCWFLYLSSRLLHLGPGHGIGPFPKSRCFMTSSNRFPGSNDVTNGNNLRLVDAPIEKRTVEERHRETLHQRCNEIQGNQRKSILSGTRKYEACTHWQLAPKRQSLDVREHVFVPLKVDGHNHLSMTVVHLLGRAVACQEEHLQRELIEGVASVYFIGSNLLHQ